MWSRCFVSRVRHRSPCMIVSTWQTVAVSGSDTAWQDPWVTGRNRCRCQLYKNRRMKGLIGSSAMESQATNDYSRFYGVDPSSRRSKNTRGRVANLHHFVPRLCDRASCTSRADTRQSDSSSQARKADYFTSEYPAIRVVSLARTAVLSDVASVGRDASAHEAPVPPSLVYTPHISSRCPLSPPAGRC